MKWRTERKVKGKEEYRLITTQDKRNGMEVEMLKKTPEEEKIKFSEIVF